jgi:hypothetical protein
VNEVPIILIATFGLLDSKAGLPPISITYNNNHNHIISMASSTYKHRTLINPSTLKGKNVVMTSHGRAPWYTPDGKSIEAYVIGIAGGSASGKTSVARAILSALGYIPTVLILSQDAFYRAHSPEELELAFKSDLDLGESPRLHI